MYKKVPSNSVLNNPKLETASVSINSEQDE